MYYNVHSSLTIWHQTFLYIVQSAKWHECIECTFEKDDGFEESIKSRGGTREYMAILYITPCQLRGGAVQPFCSEETACIASSSTKWMRMHDRISLLNAKHRRRLLSKCDRFGFRAHEDPDPVGALLGWLLGNVQEEATSGAIAS